MNIRREFLTVMIAIIASMSMAAAAHANATLLRWYKMGEQEGGVNNGSVTSTLDSPVNGGDIQAIDLSATNAPKYRTISGRPDGGTGIGIEFTGASQQYLSGDALNWPQISTLADTNGGLYDLAGIDDRGFQLWVRPTSVADQSIVRDTTEHGLRIVGGRFAMVYAGVTYQDLSQTVTPNTWYHVEVVRPNGTSSGSRMYVNGVAVAISQTIADYSGAASVQNTPMSIGSNLTNDGEFFSGILDDMRMFVMGTSSSVSPTSYGSFNFAVDNAFAASTVSGLKGIKGDVTNNGVFDATDRTAFIAGWMQRRLVNGVQIGDMASYSQGDLNFDGITNINDLLIMQQALTGTGLGAISPAELGIPEPASLLLASFAVIPFAARRRRRVGG